METSQQALRLDTVPAGRCVSIPEESHDQFTVFIPGAL